jgi:ATP-dependent DNA helicase RecG
MLEWKKQTENDVFFETQVDKTKFTFMLDIKNDVQEETVEKNEKNAEKTTRKQPENNQKNYPETRKTTQKPEKLPRKTTQKNYPENRKTTQKILSILSENSEISMQELANKIDITYDGIKWQLNKLKSQGVIRRDGADKGGKWIIIKTD